MSEFKIIYNPYLQKISVKENIGGSGPDWNGHEIGWEELIGNGKSLENFAEDILRKIEETGLENKDKEIKIYFSGINADKDDLQSILTAYKQSNPESIISEEILLYNGIMNIGTGTAAIMMGKILISAGLSH